MLVAACATGAKPVGSDAALDRFADDAPADSAPEVMLDPSPDCCGCLCADARWSCSADTCTAGGLAYQLAPEAGFFEIEPGATSEGAPIERARMWYAFWPAESEPERRPLVLFGQGGPFVSMVVLWGGNTATQTLDPARTGGEAVAHNPHSWTKVANVLYVDSPYAGFSYLVGERGAGFTKQGQPEAAAFVRLLLRFLARHPKLELAPVVLVGESYGGIRATLMLRQLLHYTDLEAPGTWYHDPALAREVRDHLQRTRRSPEQTDFAPNEVAVQFGAQVLIEAPVADAYSMRSRGGTPDDCSSDGPPDAPSSPCERQQLAEEAGARIDVMAAAIVKPAVLAALAGVDIESIAWFHAAARGDAHKEAGGPDRPVDTSELGDVFGELSSTDLYYARRSQPPGPDADWFGKLSESFLDNLRYVSTFMTYAVHDAVLDPAQVLAELPKTPSVASVERHSGPDRTDTLVVTYQDGAVRRIRSPRYEHSGHEVSLFQPDLLARDVSRWLLEVHTPTP